MSAFQRNIQNVVVLMLENRSFDHMLGFLGTPNGLTGHEQNPDPAQGGAPVTVSQDAAYVGDLDIDPSHRLEDINVQLFGTSEAPSAPPAITNAGFVLNYGQQPKATAATARNIMKCFSPDCLPALTTLAREFVVFDRWFSSVPAQTWPNRFFVHAATSMGNIDNQARVYPARTIYDNISAAGNDWAIYFHDVPQSLMLSNLQKAKYRTNFKVFAERFKRDCETGLLPSYSFIEPRYFDFLAFKANDQHPPHDVGLGDALIAEVYEALRNSPSWESTMLLILWDEHGGIYDHVLPPATVNPDSLVHVNPSFDFTRLGLRVPAVMVSPYVGRGVVDSNTYDHTSVLASIKEWLDLPQFLTRRDAQARTFGQHITDTLRSETPTSLPRATAQPTAIATTATLTPQAIESMAAMRSAEPLSEFQQSLIELTKSLPALADPRLQVATVASQPINEHQGAVHVRQTMQMFLGS